MKKRFKFLPKIIYIYIYKNKSNKLLRHDIIVIKLDLYTHSKSNHNHVYYNVCVAECATRLYANTIGWKLIVVNFISFEVIMEI